MSGQEGLKIVERGSENEQKAREDIDEEAIKKLLGKRHHPKDERNVNQIEEEDNPVA